MADKAKILLVDDEPELIEMMKMSLENAGYEVISANDGLEGIEKASRYKPDAIVLDIMMPEKDGFATCRELKENADTSDIPVLILTAVGKHFSHTNIARGMGFDLEAEDYVDKPIDPNVLLDKIAKLVKMK